MSVYILTSMFPNGFHAEAAEVFREKIKKRNKFAFVASEFEVLHEKTDKYFHFFLDMFESIGIHFEEAYVVDGRMSAEKAQSVVAEADVVWLSGGDTPVQFRYFQTYGLDKVLREHDGVIIGMSAGSINMAKTSICTLSCGHSKQEVYEGLGCVDVSVEPHFVREMVSEELLTLSEKYTIYGLCDDGLIVCSGGNAEYYGEVYKLSHGAKAGRKYELAKKRPSVGFEIDGNYRLLEGEEACDFSATFQSVIGTGVLSLVEDTDEKVAGLNTIMRQTTAKEQWHYSDEMLDAVAVFRLDVEKLSCKAKSRSRE